MSLNTREELYFSNLKFPPILGLLRITDLDFLMTLILGIKQPNDPPPPPPKPIECKLKIKTDGWPTSNPDGCKIHKRDKPVRKEVWSSVPDVKVKTGAKSSRKSQAKKVI